MTDTTIDNEQLETWSRSRPSFVLFNRAFAPAPTIFDVPAEIIDRLNGVRPDVLVASNDELDRIGIVLAHDQLAQFRKGDPVLIAMDRVDQREALKKGRRQIEGLERRVQKAHAIQTYIGVERLCEWMHASRSNLPKVPDQRRKAMRFLATEGLLDETNMDATEEADRLAFYRTQCDAGSRLAVEWYPWIENPRRLLEEVRKVVRMQLPDMNPPAIKEAIAHELRMNRFMLRCLRQATALVLAEQAMSDEIRKRGRETKHQQAALAGAIVDRPALHQAARAALDGDFNPSELFRSLLSYHDTLELARLLGRRGRGHDESLELTLVREMKRQIRLREECDDSAKQAEGALNGEHEAALVITKAAYELFRPESWRDVLDKAIAAGEAVTLTRRSRRNAG